MVSRPLGDETSTGGVRSCSDDISLATDLLMGVGTGVTVCGGVD